MRKQPCPQSGKTADIVGQPKRVIHARNAAVHFRCESCDRAIPLHDNATLYRHFARKAGR